MYKDNRILRIKLSCFPQTIVYRHEPCRSSFNNCFDFIKAEPSNQLIAIGNPISNGHKDDPINILRMLEVLQCIYENWLTLQFQKLLRRSS